MIRQLSEATPYTLVVNVPYAIALAAVAVEVAWLARRSGPARSRTLTAAGTAAVMASGALIVGVLYTAVLRVLWAMVGVHAIVPASVWRSHPVVGAVAAFVAWDLAGWIYHFIGHRTRIGWAAHQPHHSGVDFNATLGLRQSWAPFHGLIHQPLLALAGFDFRVIAACAAISNCWQILEHTSAPLRLPRWLSQIVMTPDAHRHHHGREGGAVNLGPVLTCWDRLAGTWRPADAPRPLAYGPTDGAPTNPFAIELAGWQRLWAKVGG